MMATRPPVLLSVHWLTHNALFHLLWRLGVPTLLLRYESLVRRPAAELSRVLTHAGQPAAAGELHFIGDGWVQLGTSHALAGNPMRFQQGRLPLRLDEEWRHQLSPGPAPGHRGLDLAAAAAHGYLRRPTR